MDDGLLTYEQAAQLLGRSRQCLYWYIGSGDLHPVLLYGRRLLAKHEVLRLLEKIGPKPRH